MATTKLDRSGRVVIPKRLRDDLGLKPGTALEVLEQDGAIVLRPPDRPPLKVKGHVLVFAGEARGDLGKALREQRRERTRIVMGTDGP